MNCHKDRPKCTPPATTWSPAQLLMGQCIYSNLLICDSSLKGKNSDTIRETKEIQNQKQK